MKKTYLRMVALKNVLSVPDFKNGKASKEEMSIIEYQALGKISKTMFAQSYQLSLAGMSQILTDYNTAFLSGIINNTDYLTGFLTREKIEFESDKICMYQANEIYEYFRPRIAGKNTSAEALSKYIVELPNLCAINFNEESFVNNDILVRISNGVLVCHAKAVVSRTC